MGKKKHVSSRAAQAHRRNVEQAAYRKKQAANKALWNKYGTRIIITAVAAIVLIILIWLGCKWFIGPDGSIPNFFGTLRGVEDNWLVTNTGTTANPRYYHLGSFDAPDGYTLDPDYTISSDELNQSFFYKNDTEGSMVDYVYVSGVKNKTAQEQLESLMGYNFHQEASDIVTATIGGHEVTYVYFVYDGDEEEEDSETSLSYSSLTCYVDSVANSCVLVLLNSPTVARNEIPSQEELLAEAEKIFPLLTMPN